MKRFRYIVWLCVLLVSQGITAGTQLISQDENWLGGKNIFNTTEGNDFWLTFMNIDIFDATKAENKSVPFEMAVMVSAREAMDIVVAAGNSTLTTLSLAAGETKIYEIDRNLASSLYLFTSEQTGYKGVHVYAAKKDKDKYFSCFSYCRKGNSAGSSRDASLILPTRSLGKEYYIQTSPEDSYSTQFAIVATENGTKVHITPSFNTFEDKHQAGQTFDVTLNRGDAYIVISRQHEDEDVSYNLDLSGSIVCADKPIAVFNGNQQTSVPIDPLLATDYTVEHSLPISNWGTEFYLSLLTNTKVNHFRVTAAYANTNVQVITENGTVGTLQLGAGESSLIDEYIVGVDANEFILKSDHPILCYAYTSSAHKNTKDITVDGKILKDFGYGNAANALLPAWSHRAKTMNFATHDLDPQTVRTGVVTPQNFYVFLVTKTTDTGKLSWEDGTSIDASLFRTFTADPSMSYAHIEVENNANHYHMIESSGEGFVGLVYSLSYAQGYYYTLGYTPDPFGDSLYITNQEALMSSKSYDLDSLDGHGWYQRQWNEWVEGKERLDTVLICDSSTVYWALESPKERPIDQIQWAIYDVTEGERTMLDGFPKSSSPAATAVKHSYHYQFILPEEEPQNRHPFFEYELEIILRRSPIVCEEEELDTLRTVTRVTRIYNDTTWRAICMGDTLKFFNDSLYTQRDLTKYKVGEKEETKFAATKSTDTELPDWQCNVNLGHHIFQRKYESQFGCDSIVTLMLFVCDTFRFVDTVHLCYNQDTMYHDKQYYGSLFKGPKGRTATQVVQDTSVFFINFKTDSCDCQKESFPNKDKYKDLNGTDFKGCDSIYELHVFMHKSYDLHITDTMDFKKNPDSTYVWKIERNGVQLDSLINKYSKGMVWNEKRQAWIGHFADTLRTKTCKECNGGDPQGCDSINSLTLIIPKVYFFEDTVTWCRVHYNWSRHDVDIQDYQWKGHHGDITYTQGGNYYDSCISRYNADSIYHLHLIYSEAPEPLYDLYRDTVCFDSINLYHWISKDGKIDVDTIRQDLLGTSYYVDESRCDTVYALELLVLPTYFKVDSVKMTQEEVYYWPHNKTTYGGPKATDPYDVLVSESELVVQLDTLTSPMGTHRCDSIHKLVLKVGNVYRDTIDAYVCGNENQYIWEETRPEYMKVNEQGEKEPFVRQVIRGSQLPNPGTTLLYNDPYKTVLKDDSVFYLRLYRAPSHWKDTLIGICQDTVNLFTWDSGHEAHMLYDMQTEQKVKATELSLKLPGDYYYVDSLLTVGYLCDSVWQLHLHVDPIFYRDTMVKVCQFEEYTWRNNDQDSIVDVTGRKVDVIPTEHTGDYRYDIMLHTTYGCDSIWHLTLHIDTVYTQAVSITDTVMCDKDSLIFIDHVVYGDKSPYKPASEEGIAIPEGRQDTVVYLNGKVPSSLGCDSAVQYRLTVYKTYLVEESKHACQPLAEEHPYYTWEQHDTIWDVQRNIYIPADSIPLQVEGGKEYIYIDSLRTSNCLQCNKGRSGCDSLFILHLRIDSVYEYHEERHICENERVVWQGKRYTGDKAPEISAQEDTIILSPAMYYDTVRYTTKQLCDSIYYLELHVHKVFHTQLETTVFDNEDKHIYVFTDSHGSYYRDSVPFAPHKQVLEEDTLTTYYAPQDTILEHTLFSADGGCDSIVTLKITIHPTYEFVAKGKGCWGDAVEWRGDEYSSSGIYFDSLKTQAGADSVFILQFLVKPVVTTIIHDTICASETFMHTDTLWYPDGRYSVFDQPVWAPGMTRPTYTDVTFYSHDGKCDSLIYRYYLTIRDTFVYSTHATLCSNDTFYSETLDHRWERSAFEFDTDTFVQPFDTIYTDSLQTIHGCDSLYKLYAHVLPAYRHVVYDTICENGTYTFRDHTFVPSTSGDTIIRDSLTTLLNGCDSIYELRLSVYPKYYEEDHVTICADDTYQWRSHFIEHASAGDSLVYDSLFTVHDCDSVFHLYLTVLDTTFEEHYDTICLNDTLFITQTGHFYTESGDYKDTTENEWGCHHFIYTHLKVIDPTIPTVWAEDPMCQNQTSFELYYTYTNRRPVSFSLYFDEIGKNMGFEDMIDVPIDTYTNPMVINVPIPYKDSSDPTTYPRPDNYSVHLELDNGICLHKARDCYHDTTFVMSYPKWITEQRYGDLIGILNDQVNGGYKWSSYQWYQGDTKLIGQTQPYLYIPTGLIVGEQYHVRLTREGETEDFPTCPITIEQAIIAPEYAPSMGYLSVTPTCIVTGHPFVHILSRKDGTYRITTSAGHLVREGVFRADVTEVEVSSAPGIYIFQLWSYDTPEEPYRAIKIIVSDQCENCATSF